MKKRDDCKCLFRRNTVPLKILGHCKRPPELMMVPPKCIRLKQKYLSNALYVGNSWLLVLFENTLYPLKNGWLQVKKQRSTVLWKKLFLRLNTRKHVFMNNYLGSQSFLYFAKIFVHLSVIVAVCFFSIYKLIGWGPVNLYLFKVITRYTRKRCGICSTWLINTVESHSGDLFVNFKYISQFC